jgi:methionyl aminopeptidase
MANYMSRTDTQSRGPRVKLHGEEAFEKMRTAGKLAATALDMLVEHAQPGVTTTKLNALAVEFARDHNAIPATVFYRGYNHAICTSINHVVCHGMPNDKPLLDGDIVNIDLALIVDGWYGDTSRMANVGVVSRKAERLVEITYESLMRGIATVKAGSHLGDIGHAIQSFAESERCSVVRDFCGHGLGQVFHDHPNVLHYGRAGEGIELKKGMIFTVEPMINLGKPHVKVLGDGWTAVTRDRSLSAQFEHTIGVTETGCEIFTLSPKGLHCPPYRS